MPPASTISGSTHSITAHAIAPSESLFQKDSSLTQELTQYIFLEERLSTFDVAICLGCTSYSKPIRKGIQLYHSGHCSKLLLTGGENARLKGNEAMLMAGLALAAGIPSRDLIVDPCASNTLENCTNAIDLLHRHQHSLPPASRRKPRTALVAIHFHSRRALETFRWVSDGEVLPTVIPYPSSYYTYRDWFQSQRGCRDVLGEIARMETYLPLGFSPELEYLVSRLRSYSVPSTKAQV
ncbi:YdcF family protein [Cyanobium sp. PCC 7001]|uniref:YdcF family protein n=1 Tax=Cyanobium sp. PCC 7001 TaxID=180281 RepID=UPI0008FEDD35